MTDSPGYLITDLKMNQCRFPITPFNARSHRFCGAYASNPDKPWCQKHRAIVFDQRSAAEIKREGQGAKETFARNKFIA